jgi:hypothetical protein
MPGPRHGFEPLGIDLFATGNTLSETAFSNASERAIHHVQELTVVVALTEEKFLVIGTRSAISDVLRRLIIGGAPVLLILDNHLTQLVAPGFKPLLKSL